MVSYSQSVQEMRTSEIRDLMSSATDPNIISFAGGMPNNELFPVEEINELYNNMDPKIKKIGFQYGPTPGYPPLLETLKEYLRSKGLPVDTNELMITSGSMQALSIITKVFIDPYDIIITELPCFVGGIGAFKAHLADMRSVPMDADGLIMEKLDEIIETAEKKPKLIYLSPYFHNPAGVVYKKERKLELVDYLKDKDIVMLEDDPYNELYFNDDILEDIIPMKTIEQDAMPICYIGSFSKILGPGMRLGWILTSPEIYAKCELTKQSFDACSSTFTQVIANEFISRGKLQPYVENLRPIYKRRMNLTNESLKEFMPEEVTWVEPKGGFYTWLTLPANIDATEVLQKSIKKGAIFVVGKTFDPKGVKNNNIRLAFSYPREDKLREGVKIVAESIKEFL